ARGHYFSLLRSRSRSRNDSSNIEGSPGFGFRNPLISFSRELVSGGSTSLPPSSLQVAGVPFASPKRSRSSAGMTTWPLELTVVRYARIDVSYHNVRQYCIVLPKELPITSGCRRTTPMRLKYLQHHPRCIQALSAERRGTGGHRELRANWRTSPKDHRRLSSRKETSPRTHHLSDSVRLLERAPGRRSCNRHRSGGRLAGPDHARLREHSLHHDGRNAASCTCRQARGEKCPPGRGHALWVLSRGRGCARTQCGNIRERSWSRSGED